MLRGQVSLTFTKEGTEGHGQATEGWDCWQTFGVSAMPGDQSLGTACQMPGQWACPGSQGPWRLLRLCHLRAGLRIRRARCCPGPR